MHLADWEAVRLDPFAMINGKSDELYNVLTTCLDHKNTGHDVHVLFRDSSGMVESAFQ